MKNLLKIICTLLSFSLSFGEGWGEAAFAQTTKGLSVVQPQTEQKPTGKTYALVVGISDYPHVQPLNYASEDALLFYQFLTSKAGGSVAKNNIRLLVDEEATAAGIWHRGISWLQQQKPTAGDKVIFYFSGHGDAVDAHEAYFLAYDANPGGDKNNYAITGTLDIEKLKNRIRDFTANGVEVTLVIDACRTADIPGGKAGLGDYQSVIEKNVGELLFLSCSPNEVSYEDKRWGNGHGAFTWHLVNGLAGKADEDKDGKVSVYEIKKYVEDNVTHDTRAIGHVQTPFYCCSVFNENKIATADNDFKNDITKSEMAGGDKFSAQLLAARKVNDNFLFKDSLLKEKYFVLKKLCRAGKLIGTNSADSVYTLLAKKYTEKDLQPLKEYFVSALLDEAQAAVNKCFENFDKEELPSNYYTVHYAILKRAMDLSSATNPDLVKAEYPRLIYLECEKKIEGVRMNFDKSGFFSVKTADSTYVNDLTFHNEIIKKLKSCINLGYDYAGLYMEIAMLFRGIGMCDRKNKERYQDSILHYAEIAKQKAPQWAAPYSTMAAFMKYKDAEKLLLGLLTIDSSNVNYLNAVGYFYWRSNADTNYVNTKLYFEKSIHIDINQPNIVWELLSLYQRTQQNYLTGINPTSENVGCELVIPLAEKYFLTKNKHIQNSINAWVFRSVWECFLRNKKYDELKVIANKQLEIGDSTYVLSLLYVLEKDIYKNKKRADSIFQTGLNSMKRNGYLQWGEKQEADYPSFYEEIGDVYSNMGDKKNKEEILLKAIKDYPNNKTALTSLKYFYLSERDSNKANSFKKELPYLKQLVVLDSNSFYTYNDLADAYLNLKDTLNCVKTLHFPSTLKLQINHFRPLAMLYLRMKKTNEAVNCLQNAFDKGLKDDYFIKALKDSTFAALDTSTQFNLLLKKVTHDTIADLGDMYFTWKKYNKAILSYQQKSSFGKDVSGCNYFIACCYALQNDKTNALKYLELALQNGFAYYEKISDNEFMGWHLHYETDLSNISTTDDFAALLKKYGQVKK